MKETGKEKTEFQKKKKKRQSGKAQFQAGTGEGRTW